MPIDATNLYEAPRELIKKFADAMANKFILRDYFQGLKEMFPRLQETLSKNGKCWACGDPVDGHFLEECVARKVGRIDHMYTKKEELAQKG